MINSHLLSADDQLVKSQLLLGRYHVKVEVKVAALLKRGIRNLIAVPAQLICSRGRNRTNWEFAQYLNGRVGDNRTGYEHVRLGVGSSNLSTSGVTDRRSPKTYCSQSKHAPRLRYTLSNRSIRPHSVARDFKSLVSISERRLVRANAGIHHNRSHSPVVVTGFSSRQQGLGSYQQKPVRNSNNPRINTTALAELSTHKRNRFGLKVRINATAFTHKRNRLCASKLRGNWSTATSPVSTSITNNPIVKNKTYIGYAKIRINSYE